VSDTAIANETELTRAEESRVGDYIALLKPRVMSLVLFTGYVGLEIAPGSLHPVLAITALLCIAVAAGASGAINMWYDADIDAIMDRTKTRPIPSGRVTPKEALVFGGFLSAISVMTMGVLINWMAAGLLAFTVFFYVAIYTMWLKRSTPQNIVIGGAAGALPPVVGWAAVTGDVALPSLTLFAIIFMWTPPHFWALALYRNEDYTRAGVPMLPVVAGRAATKRQMMIYTVALFGVTLLPFVQGYAGPLYLGGAIVSGLLFIAAAWSVLRSGETEFGPAKRMFGYSILYLFLLFALLPIERALGIWW